MHCPSAPGIRVGWPPLVKGVGLGVMALAVSLCKYEGMMVSVLLFQWCWPWTSVVMGLGVGGVLPPSRWGMWPLSGTPQLAVYSSSHLVMW